MLVQCGRAILCSQSLARWSVNSTNILRSSRPPCIDRAVQRIATTLTTTTVTKMRIWGR